MVDNEKRYGRTVWDVISEHPKLTVLIFLIIILVIAVLIYLGFHFKYGNLEVGQNPKPIHDTLITTKVDTQFINEQQIPKKEPILKTSPAIVERNIKKITVKSGDTVVTVQNQLANVNTGTNNGIIGNNNDIKVNVNALQRTLNPLARQQLITLIDSSFKKLKRTDSCISVLSVTGDSEALNFAKEILQFLKQQNLKVGESVGQFTQAPPIKGARVGITFDKKCISVLVGYR